VAFQLEPLSAEEELQLQEQLLRGVKQPVLAVDLTGRVLFWNHIAESHYGWNAVEVLGHNIGEVLEAPLSRDLVRTIMGQLRRGEDWSGDIVVHRRDATTYLAQVSALLIRIGKRTLIGVVGLSKNGTEQSDLDEANRLLAEAGARLINAVDYETPLTTLAQLAVPQLADLCAVHLLQADGSIEQVALAPAEMAKLQAAYDWLQNHLPKDDAAGLPAVLRSGQPKLVPDVTSDLWAAAAEIKSYMIVPLITRPQTIGAITLVTAESGRHFDRSTLAVAENLASHIAIYLDKARLYRESQRLNAELEKRVDERTVQLQQSESTIQTLFRISNKLNATLDVDAIVDELAQEAIRIVDGESGFAGLRTAEGMTVNKYFHKGVMSPFKHTWPEGNGIPGWVLKYKIPYGTSDAAHDPLLQHELPINTDVRSIICTPILDSFGEVMGYFDIRNKQNAEGFTIADQEMLMALAPAASIAIQNALAYQQRLGTVAELKESSSQLQALAANLELAREEERTRIALELHDQLGQALTAMKYDLAWLTERLVQKDATLGKKAKAVTLQMDTMIKTVRRISTELRPGMLDDLGLAATIEWQAGVFQKRTGVECIVSILTEDLPLARAQSVALFRIFQEALTNITRHANAKHVEVSLSSTLKGLTLQVHDDGRGIQAHEINGHHSLGLLGMRERAKRLGGTFDIQAGPNGGTILTVSIPVKPKT